jgi:DNA polymerase-3 subunit alpha
MAHAEFVHLHNHTEYSLLDGACRITNDKGQPGDFIKLMADYKMPALAITDHGNMFGALEFYSTCLQAGINPIIGCEVYVTPGSRFDKNTPPKQAPNRHLTLLAENNEGYQNLLELVSAANLEGFYYKPRVDKELLEKHSKGLICLSGCLQGELARTVLEKDIESGKKVIDRYKSIFGSKNFYIELMDNNIPEQKKVMRDLIELGKTTNTGLVATNDSHYLHKQDAYAHDILLCIGTGVTIDNPNRLKFSTEEFYYKSPPEMIKIFKSVPDAIKNTLEISNRCSITLNFEQFLLPYYELPENENPNIYLKKLCEKGLKHRYDTVTPEIKDRLGHELSLIEKMGFASYFLIVSDVIQYAKANNIPVGPGRGSGAGSLVAYSLGITDICPLKYGLLFERFLNPERRTMPDLDIDFADFGRDAVIEYVRKKYGEHNVAQIITFGAMRARLVIRDVARVLGFPVSDADRLAKLIPFGMTIYQALNNSDEFNRVYQEDKNISNLINIARKLEGLKRHTSVHAAGLVIAKDKITKFTPLMKSSHGGQEITVTQYNDDALIKLGLLKVDFLGLRTLTVLDNTIRMLGKGKKFDIHSIPLDDPKTFKLLQEAKTAGIFQLESSGMRDLLRKLKPTVFEDIFALVSLFRPGPMGSGMLDEFVKRKHQKTKVRYDHKLLEPILKDTYGVIVYQEQVMRIATTLAGFSVGHADILRRAMGKKIPEEIERERDTFIKGAKDKGIEHKIAEKIFDKILHFGGYGFNKSHAAAYGLLAYYTAYFKANHPVDYMCALLTSEIGKSSIGKEEGSKLLNYVNEAKQMGIKILTPDLQKSGIAFSIEDGAIRFGLLATKNVGEAASENIVSARNKHGPFKSLQDFCSKIDTRQVNRKVIESLIKSGSFDFLGKTEKIALPSYIRSKAMHDLEKIYSTRGNINQGQKTLFDLTGEENPSIPPWPDHVMLGYEKDVLGFYFSGHPLAQYRKIIESASTHKINSLPTDNSPVRIAGMIVNIKRLVSKKKGEQYARFKLENFDGEIDVLVFPRSYSDGMGK